MPPVIRDSEEEEEFTDDNSVGEYEEDESAKQYRLKYANDSELSISDDDAEAEAGASSDVPETSMLKDDDEDEEDEEEDEEDEEDEEELESDADNYKLEDPDDDMDEDLELRDDDDDIKSSPKKASPAKVPIIRLKLGKPPPGELRQAPVRETRKRQLTFYEEDDDEDEDDEDEDEEEIPKPRIKKLRVPEPQIQPTDLDADLILTDEETEYNPHANPDLSKMTERQRARYLEEAEPDEKKFVELGDKNAKKPPKKQRETEEQAALRKAENARKRLDYKNKLLEEEKRDTLNKLLKRRAAKTREVQTTDGGNEVKLIDKPRRAYVEYPGMSSWRNGLQGSVLGLPAVE